VLFDGQFGFVVQDLIQHVGRVAGRGGNRLAAVQRVLVGGPGVVREAASVPEVPRQSGGIASLDCHWKTLPVRGRERAGAPGSSQWLLVLKVDQLCDGGFERLLP